MNTLQGIALIILGLLIGLVSTTYGLDITLLIFTPLFLLWFTLWDDKQYRKMQRRKTNAHCYPSQKTTH
ncbi:MAG: hypothetical protein ACK5MW_06720 [Enterococcus sp.]